MSSDAFSSITASRPLFSIASKSSTPRSTREGRNLPVNGSKPQAGVHLLDVGSRFGFEPGLGISQVEQVAAIGRVRGSEPAQLFGQAMKLGGISEACRATSVYAEQQRASGGSRKLQAVHAQAQFAVRALDRIDAGHSQDRLKHGVDQRRQTPSAGFQACFEISVIPQIDRRL